MDNQAAINKESWKEVWKILFHPAVLLPFVLGFGSLYLLFNINDLYWKLVFTSASSIGIGIGVNYFTFFFKDNTKFNNLMLEMNQKIIIETVLKEKVANTVRNLKAMNDTILSHYSEKHVPLDDFGRKLISDIATVVKSYENYYDFKSDFDADISNYKRLGNRIDDAPNQNEKEFLIYQRNNYELVFSTYKIQEYVSATGSLKMEDTIFKSIKPEPDRFMGSSVTKKTFDTES